MLTQPRRLVSAALAIMLGVAFVAAALALGSTFTATIAQAAAGSIGDSSLVVTTRKPAPGAPSTEPGPRITQQYADAVRALPGVTGTRPQVSTIFMQDLGSRQAVLVGATAPAPDLVTVRDGRLPSAAGEVAVNTAVADSRSVSVGSQIRFAAVADASGSAGDGGEVATPQGRVATVVGIVSAAPGVDSGNMPSMYASNADLLAWSGLTGYDELLVTGGQDDATLQAQASALPGAAAYVVRGHDAEVEARVSEATNGTQALTGLVLAFAAISVLVSAIVIANTFSILIAQRTRELALLRCVGASRRQVFRTVLREALLVSIVASLAGMALGFALVAGLSALSQGTSMPLAGLRLDVPSVVVPLLVGVVVTVLSAVVPARRATRVRPLAALRPELAAPTKTRAGRVRLAMGTLLFAGGAAGLILAGRRPNLTLGLAGGAASMIGTVLLGSVFVPALARVLGALPARLGGLPGRLAVDNSRRNPARAASTASALFVGVSLITLMSVGAASGQATIDAEIDKQAPVDVIVATAQGTPLPGGTLDRVRKTAGIESAASVASGQVTIDAGSGPRPTTVTGVSPQAPAVIRYAPTLAGLADDTLLVRPSVGIADGATVTVTGRQPGRSLTLRAKVNDEGLAEPVVTAAVLDRLGGPSAGQVWARMTPGADVTATNEALGLSLAGIDGVSIGGSAQQRAQIQQIVSIVLYVVTGLLAVAVVIALVGVGNTLGLSVLERTRENGLLRALGVTRRQVRSMLGIEALTLAAAGAVLGVVLGIGYGVAGAHALLGADMAVTVAVPWERLALVVVVALAAGWLASVVPGVRAARVPPSAALASE